MSIAFGTFRDDDLTGTSGNDLLFGWFGDDTLSGGAGDDILVGGFGDDVLIGGEGDDLLLGGRGFDTAIYEGEIGDYCIDKGWCGVLEIEDLQGDEGHDYLLSVEKVVFENGTSDAADDITYYVRAGVILGSDTDDDIVGTKRSDKIIGGKDDGAFALGAESFGVATENGTEFVALTDIENEGDTATVSARDAAVRITWLGRLPDGDGIFRLSNGTDTDAQWALRDPGGNLTPVDVAANTAVVINVGQVADGLGYRIVKLGDGANPPGGTASSGDDFIGLSEGLSLTVGDVLAGGEGCDVFCFAKGDGVDQITDYDGAHDAIVIKGFAADEVEIIDRGGDALIAFTDGSGGYVEDNAILVDNAATLTVDDLFFC